jgi:large subunit ribosomal protein L10
MSVTHAHKQEQIDFIKDRFARAVAAVLVDFRGLNVAKTTELRNAFRKAGVEYKVVKNTLIHKAVEGTKLDDEKFIANLIGQTGIAWSYEDPSAAAKVLKDFRKDEAVASKLAIKCGVIENMVMEGPRVESELATMPGKNEIRAMLLAQLLAPAQSLVRQLSAPGQNLSYVIDARRRQLLETDESESK